MAEQIVNEFTVNRPIDEAWPIICDLERIAPCMPGAQLEEVEGDTYRGRVRVKLGAVATEFKGEAEFVERDDEHHRAKLKGSGRDTKGRGNASADILAEAESLSPTSTKVSVTADLHVTGKVAQFGRGILGDVSKKLINEFSSNLNQMIDDDTPTDTEAVGDSDGASESDDDEAAAPGAASEPATEKVRKIDGPAAEPIDVADYAGGAVIKRYGPAIAAVLIVLLLVRKLR